MTCVVPCTSLTTPRSVVPGGVVAVAGRPGGVAPPSARSVVAVASAAVAASKSRDDFDFESLATTTTSTSSPRVHLAPTSSYPNPFTLRAAQYPIAPPCFGSDNTTYSGLTSSTTATVSVPFLGRGGGRYVVDASPPPPPRVFFDRVFFGDGPGFIIASNPGLAPTSTTPSRRLTSKTTPFTFVPSSGGGAASSSSSSAAAGVWWNAISATRSESTSGTSINTPYSRVACTTHEMDDPGASFDAVSSAESNAPPPSSSSLAAMSTSAPRSGVLPTFTNFPFTLGRLSAHTFRD
mmetsp:Transcript_2798/g.9066  ORF Transcript_2798/g.9066 Transcript_2798/m.9066 type:complete len:293 (-) Transcript_2798:395-1273(-)